MAIKKTTKKVVKAAKEVVKKVDKALYNDFGVCLACNGGNLNCTHNNLVQHNQSLVCATCGFKVK